MLSKQGFDLWAKDYDKTVQLSEENNEYPFAGYKQILNTIFNEVMHQPQSKVLDIGFGTAILTSQLYNHGHQIDGIDFSAEMIRLASEKMPDANLYEFDIQDGFPLALEGKQYDSLISTYTLHHLNNSEKALFIHSLLPYLKSEGRIYIGDIAFDNKEKMEQCRLENQHHWDSDEFYFIIDEFIASMGVTFQVDYYPHSHCGGVLILTKK